MNKKDISKLYYDPDLYESYKQKFGLIQSGESNCCGAPVIDQAEMCSQCFEYCDYRNPVCLGCGEEYPEWETDGVCSSKCKKASIYYDLND